MAESFKNILIMKPSSLGDVVLALPALSALRRKFPDARISWLIRPEFAPLIEGHPHLNEIILFDRKYLGQAWWNPKAFKALVSLIFKLRKEKYDAVVDLHNLFRTAILGWLSGCKRRFGMAQSREFSSIFYTDKTPHDEGRQHIVDFYMMVVGLMGADADKVQFVFPENATDSVKRMLRENGIEKGYIVLIPGASRQYKCWPVEKFAQLADKLAESYGLPITAVGSSSEKEITSRLKSLAGTKVIDLAGKTNLRELTVLLRSASLVVSNDTGPGQIAAALGTPMVMIFGNCGKSDQTRVGPYGRMECIAAVDYSKKSSNKDQRFVKTITVEQVYERACEQFERYKSNNN